MKGNLFSTKANEQLQPESEMSTKLEQKQKELSKSRKYILWKWETMVKI